MRPSHAEVRQHLDAMDMLYGVADPEADPLEHEWSGRCEECGEEMAAFRCSCMDPTRSTVKSSHPVVR